MKSKCLLKIAEKHYFHQNSGIFGPLEWLRTKKNDQKRMKMDQIEFQNS